MGRRVHVVILLSFFFLLMSNTCSFGQLAPRTDSLEALLEQADGANKAELLLELSDQNQRSQVDTALSLVREALAISQRLENEPLRAESHRKLGRLLSMNGRNPEGLEYLLNAEKLFKATGNRKKRALVLENIGALYRRQGQYRKALESYFKALEIREEMAEQGDIERTLLNIGIVHEQLHQPEKSTEFYNRGLEISRKKKDASSIAIIATQLGNMYASVGNLNDGIRYVKEALAASKQLPGEHARATILLSLSSIYKDNKLYGQALDANREALALADSMNHATLEVLAQKNIAEIYIFRGDRRLAHEYLLKAIQRLEDGGSLQEIIATRNLMARNHLAMGDYTQSREQARQALEAATNAKAYESAFESLEILVKVHEQTGNYEKAAANYKRMTALKDSMYSAEQARRVAEMQTRYETEQKEKEIALLEREKEQEALLRNTFLAGLILIGIIGFLVYNRQRLKIQKNRAELENRRLKEQKLQQDLEFRNRQLTTHTLHLVQKNGTMRELKEKISEIRHHDNGEASVSHALKKLENMMDYSFHLDEEWEQFRLFFEEVHNGFFDSLKEQYPELTPNELRLAALVRLNLSIKETAAIMGITPDSVKTARYRLRKKLDLETEENLTEFMMEI